MMIGLNSRNLRKHALTLAFSLGTVVALSNRAQGHDEMFIGFNSAGQLVVDNHQHVPMPMQVSAIPGYRGWTAAGPGIESALKDNPDEDFFALPSTAQIQIVLSDISPTLHLFNSDGSGFVPPGETYVVLSPFFHWHCFWNLSEGTYGTIYSAQFTFYDLSGQFSPSEPVTVEFVPHCPGDADMNTEVNVGDLLAVINGWGECPGGCGANCVGDFDLTCSVDVIDLLTVINNWGVCVPPQ